MTLTESLRGALAAYRQGRLNGDGLAEAVEVALAVDTAAGRFATPKPSEPPLSAPNTVMACRDCGTPGMAPTGSCFVCHQCGWSSSCS